MDRRHFLKAIGVIVGSIYVPPFQLVIPETVIPQGLQWFGTAREVFAYDIRTDEILMRHDVLSHSHKTQLHVSYRLDSTNLKEDIEANRKTSEELLLEEMKKRGIKITDLIPLPPLDCGPIPSEVRIALGY